MEGSDAFECQGLGVVVVCRLHQRLVFTAFRTETPLLREKTANQVETNGDRKDIVRGYRADPTDPL